MKSFSPDVLLKQVWASLFGNSLGRGYVWCMCVCVGGRGAGGRSGGLSRTPLFVVHRNSILRVEAEGGEWDRLLCFLLNIQWEACPLRQITWPLLYLVDLESRLLRIARKARPWKFLLSEGPPAASWCQLCGVAFLFLRIAPVGSGAWESETASAFWKYIIKPAS